MLLRRLVLVIASVVSFAAVACGDGAKSPTLQPGVPGSTQIGDLTDAQAKQLCLGFQALANELAGVEQQKRIKCVAAGAVAQSNGGSCQESYEACIAYPSNEQPIILDCDAATATPYAGCTATVDQVTACVNGVSATVDPLIDGVSCKIATDSDAVAAYRQQIEAATTGASVPACETLQDACPTLFDALSR